MQTTATITVGGPASAVLTMCARTLSQAVGEREWLDPMDNANATELQVKT